MIEAPDWEIAQAAARMGRKGGKSKSAVKIAASLRNLGKVQHRGRPRMADDKIKPSSLKRRQYRDKVRGERT